MAMAVAYPPPRPVEQSIVSPTIVNIVKQQMRAHLQLLVQSMVLCKLVGDTAERSLKQLAALFYELLDRRNASAEALGPNRSLFEVPGLEMTPFIISMTINSKSSAGDVRAALTPLKPFFSDTFDVPLKAGSETPLSLFVLSSLSSVALFFWYTHYAH